MAQAAPIGATAERAAARSRGADFLSLTKPRLNSLVLVTTRGRVLPGRRHRLPWLHLFHTMVGTALVAGGASALNQVWERDTDRLMRRTRRRPLPDARLQPQDALWFGVLLSALGVAELALAVNQLTAIVAALTLVSYVFLYTPLKLRTLVFDHRRRGARSAAGGHRLDGRYQFALGRRLGAVRHRLHVADAALPGHRVDVSRRLRQRRHSAAPGHSA